MVAVNTAKVVSVESRNEGRASRIVLVGDVAYDVSYPFAQCVNLMNQEPHE
jgi:hypothetical protein